VALEHGQRRVRVGHGLLVHARVEGHGAEDRVEPAADGHLEVVRDKVHPRVDLRLLEEGAAGQLRVAPDLGDIARDGVALEERAVGRLEQRQAAARALGQELGRLVADARLDLADLQLDACGAAEGRKGSARECGWCVRV
jgi:hypothetical protein